MTNSEERRVVVIKPGDVLLIGNLHSQMDFENYNIIEDDTDRLQYLLRRIGFEHVLFFGGDITIGSVPAGQAKNELGIGMPFTVVEEKSKCAHCDSTANLVECGRCSPPKHWCVASFYTKQHHSCARR